MHSIRASGDKIRLLCAFLKLNKFFEKSKKFALRKVFLLRSIFSSIFLDFSKNLFNFKKAQRSRILSPEALIEYVRKVFIYSLLLKRWSFWTHRIRLCLEHKNTFFFEKYHLGSISILPKTQKRLTKNIRKTALKKLQNFLKIFFRKKNFLNFRMSYLAFPCDKNSVL